MKEFKYMGINSGVIFWRGVQAMIHVWNQWLYNYEERYTSVKERGGSIQLVRDQSSLLAALLTYRLQVKPILWVPNGTANHF
jgi:hypothetical protein